jgi:hypothetical protein
MALTDFQRTICRLLADARIASGASYVAGGVALNTATAADRVSRDIDLFHDTEAAVAAAWEADRALLLGHGLVVDPMRERPGFVEARVAGAHDAVLVQWARDSAYRFFPLVTHPDFGLTLHPLDLAANKVLALVGRVEVRDWVDLIACDGAIQPLGYLAFAACGKDPGFSPLMILEQAARTARYSAGEVAALDFGDSPPDPAALSREWRRMLEEAHAVLEWLPSGEAGSCVLTVEGTLCRAPAQALQALREGGHLRFHRGRIGGAWPEILRKP